MGFQKIGSWNKWRYRFFEKWIVNERCRLVALLGMEGIGKTALATILVDGIQDKFKYCYWRSLRYAPPLKEVLVELLRFLSQQDTDLPDSVDALFSILMSYLHNHRCLLVLDNFETVLKSGDLAGGYREGYEGYRDLIRRIAEEGHQSCLAIASREKPGEIAFLEGKTTPVRSLTLSGLHEVEAREIFKEKGLSDPEQWRRLTEIYRGSPLGLKIVAAAIKESFNGRVSEFLKYNTIFIGYISEILDRQFERLSEIEKEIMYELAIQRKPISLDQLREDRFSKVSASELVSVLESLGRRFLIEKIPEESGEIFTLQPVVMKYVTNRLNSRCRS